MGVHTARAREPFPVLPGLETAVQFWKKVFTKYGKSQIIFFDPTNPTRIYQVVEAGEGRRARRQIRIQRSRIMRRHGLKSRRDVRSQRAAGAGRWRGGLGAVCDLEYQGEGVARLNTAGDGVIVPPFGLFGGEPGEPHLYKIVSNGTDRVLRSKETGVLVNPGDRIVCLSSGGGGYGAPEQRAEASVRSDLRNGYCTEPEAWPRPVPLRPPAPGHSGNPKRVDYNRVKF